MPLTALAVEVLDKPDNLNVTVELAGAVLDGLATETLGFTVEAVDASVTSATIRLRVTTAEAPPVDIPVQVASWRCGPN